MKRWIRAAVLGLAGFAQSQSIAALWDKSPHWWLQLLSLAILTGALTYEQS